MTPDKPWEARHAGRQARLTAIWKALSQLQQRVRRSAGHLRTWVAVRHDSGAHSLFCLDVAHHHYGEPTHGLGYRAWQVRNYCRGFFHP